MKKQFKITKPNKGCYDGKKLNLYYLDECLEFHTSMMKKPKPLHTDYQFGKSFRFYNIFYGYYSMAIFWVRIYGGYGIWGKRSQSPMLFSQRHGYTKHLVVFGWRLSILKPK